MINKYKSIVSMINGKKRVKLYQIGKKKEDVTIDTDKIKIEENIQKSEIKWSTGKV